jgi:hypothetical protein
MESDLMWLTVGLMVGAAAYGSLHALLATLWGRKPARANGMPRD